ncbi:MAG: hypothetical protein ACKPKO_62000, partial [Candidatus Fonsibacter sp.]
ITCRSGSFQNLTVTGTSGRPQTPTAQGCYIGQASLGYTAIELVSGVGASFSDIYRFHRAECRF